MFTKTDEQCGCLKGKFGDQKLTLQRELNYQQLDKAS